MRIGLGGERCPELRFFHADFIRQRFHFGLLFGASGLGLQQGIEALSALAQANLNRLCCGHSVFSYWPVPPAIRHRRYASGRVVK